MKKMFWIIALLMLVNVLTSCSSENKISNTVSYATQLKSSDISTSIDRKREPRQDIGVTINGDFATTFIGNDFKYSNIKLTSVAIAPYSIIIAGGYDDEEKTGYINERKGDPNDIMNTEWNDYKLKGTGPIILKELVDDNQKVLFTYDEGKKKGYFDIKSSMVILEEDK